MAQGTRFFSSPAKQDCLAVRRADINPSQTGPPEQALREIEGLFYLKKYHEK